MLKLSSLSEVVDYVTELRDLQRALSVRLSDVERWFAESNRRELTYRSELLRQRSLLLAIATPAQREAFARELVAGVHDVEQFVEAANLHADATTAADRAPRSPHVWKPGDIAYIVIQEFARADSPRCWNAFFDEEEADDFMASILKVQRPNDCDAALTRKTIAQVIAVDVFSNTVTTFDEHTLVI